jgi:hypothetical protein
MRRFLCIALLALLGGHTRADEGPSLIIAPKIALAPLPAFHWIARIPRDPANRAFCVSASLDTFTIRRSCEDLDGMDSAAVFDKYWDTLNEPGTYTITLAVVDARGHVTRTSQILTLRGGTDDPDRDRSNSETR